MLEAASHGMVPAMWQIPVNVHGMIGEQRLWILEKLSRRYYGETCTKSNNNSKTSVYMFAKHPSLIKFCKQSTGCFYDDLAFQRITWRSTTKKCQCQNTEPRFPKSILDAEGDGPGFETTESKGVFCVRIPQTRTATTNPPPSFFLRVSGMDERTPT